MSAVTESALWVAAATSAVVLALGVVRRIFRRRKAALERAARIAKAPPDSIGAYFLMLWCEDPSTVGHPDHETIEQAWLRLFGEPEPLIATSTRLKATGLEVRLYPLGRVAHHSKPGDSRIYQILQPPKDPS